MDWMLQVWFKISFTLKHFPTHANSQSIKNHFIVFAGQINVSSIVAAASLVARTLQILVTGNSTLESSFISINESLVQQLTDCLLTCDPGMTCSLVRSFITPTQKCPNHYVGVFLGNPLEQEALENIDDTARFVWNYLAYHTASSVNVTAVSECSTSCEDANKVCVASTVEHKGICVPSTTRYNLPQPKLFSFVTLYEFILLFAGMSQHTQHGCNMEYLVGKLLHQNLVIKWEKWTLSLQRATGKCWV